MVGTRVHFIFAELRQHLPFTLVGVASGVTVLAIIQWLFATLAPTEKINTFRDFFHLFHFLHLFLSAIASAALFFRYSQRGIKTFGVGLFGTLIACGLSDILIPFLGGSLLGIPMKFHLCLVETPLPVFGVTALGVITGIFSESRIGRISYVSHSAHVFTSSFASLFYLVAFGVENWLAAVPGIFAITVLAVLIPCCSSDIVIPLSFIGGTHGHEHEDEHTVRSKASIPHPAQDASSGV